MYILKNAFLSIRRNKGRNILIGIIVLIVSCAATVTLAIRSSASTLVSSYDDKYDITATIGINREGLMQEFKPGERNLTDLKDVFNDIPALTATDIDNYGNSEYVKSYYYTYNLMMNAKDIEKATSEDSGFQTGKLIARNANGEEINIGDFNLNGYSSYEAMNEFINGKYNITSGEVSSDFESNNCVISSELATLNDLEVGDTITLVNPNDETKIYDLKITGIYTENEDSEEASNNRMNMFSNSANIIITNNKVIENITTNDDTLKASINPTFILKNKDVIDAYEAELKAKGMNGNYTLSTNLDTIQNGTKTITNVSTFAITFLIIVLLIGSVVLFVLNMINIRERKYEIGVLRTIGMKKSLVITQFVTELLVISVFALLVGCGIGSLISVPTANKLLEQEVISAKEETNNIGNRFGTRGNTAFQTGPGNIRFNGVANIDYVSEINAVVNVNVIMQLLGIGLLLTLFSGTAAVVGISRFSPLTILRERS